MIKRITAVLVLFLGLAVASFGQDVPPTQHFVISGSVAGYKGTDAVSIASTGFQLTKNVSLAYEQIFNAADSSQARYYSGVANYTREVSSLIPAKLKSKIVFDTSNYLVTFQAGAGRESLAGVAGGPRSSHIVGNFGIYGGRQVAAHAQLGAGYKFIVGPSFALIKVPVGNLNFTF